MLALPDNSALLLAAEEAEMILDTEALLQIDNEAVPLEVSVCEPLAVEEGDCSPLPESVEQALEVPLPLRVLETEAQAVSELTWEAEVSPLTVMAGLAEPLGEPDALELNVEEATLELDGDCVADASELGEPVLLGRGAEAEADRHCVLL